MKLFILACLLVAVAAQPPRFRASRFRSQRQELAPSTTESTAEPTTERSDFPAWRPYQPSGWRPDQAFNLPEAPAQIYGAPNADVEVTEEPQSEPVEEAVEVQKSVGEYFVLLPNGQLQRVEFMTENDVQNMAYTARLRVQDRAPLFLILP